MRKLPVRTPEKLFDLLGIPEEVKYAAIYYQGSNPLVDTGYSVRSFSYYGLYEPMITHLAIFYYLGSNVNLGSDDFPPTDALIFQRDGFIAVQDWKKTEYFLRKNNPAPQPKSEEEIKQWYENIKKNPANFGSFEIFNKVSPDFQELSISVIQDLDKQVTKEMLHNAIEISQSSPPLYFVLNRLMSRIKRTIADKN